MTLVRSVFLAVAMAVSSGSTVLAQDFDKGLAAYEVDDFATALLEWRPLAEQGDADAQYYLGIIYQDGDGVPQDHSEAGKWYLLAAEQGEARAQFNLAAMYYLGQGVPQDYAEAVTWSRLSAEQGNASAQSILGLAYSFGDDVPQDNVKAHMWYNIASANGDSDAGEWRDERAALMSLADISKAQAMARECMSSGYSDCGW